MSEQKLGASTTVVEKPSRLPIAIGLIAGVLAVALSLSGMVMNQSPTATPLTLRSIALVILIAGGSWGLIAWAITTAVIDVEREREEEEAGEK
jgi:uncharacterized membrane protein